MKNLTGIYWIKDEARYIPEYIEFHLLQGFDHFIFYDNGSTDNLLEVISPYIEAGLVEIRYYPELNGASKNFWLMDHCCIEQRGKSKWVHFHALDERLFCPDGTKVTDFLKDYEQYGGVSVAWLYFNSNGHLTRPEGLIIDNYTECYDDPLQHIKTIIQPEKTINHKDNPHQFHYEEGNIAVDENFTPVSGPHNPGKYSYKKIKLHHYLTMSKQEHFEKHSKGVLDGGRGTEDALRKDYEESWNRNHDKEKYHFWNDNLLSERYSKTIKENILKRYLNKEYLLQFINH